jgi:hypothetical protein
MAKGNYGDHQLLIAKWRAEFEELQSHLSGQARLNGKKEYEVYLSSPLSYPRELSHDDPQRADPLALNLIYSALLTRLGLTEEHGEALCKRGLSDFEIARRRYGSLTTEIDRPAIANWLRKKHGEWVLRVPGVIVLQHNDGPIVTLAGAVGLLVPVRDAQGRIAALIVRRDGDSAGPRYSYLSSKKFGGPGPGAPVHVPLGVTAPCHTVRITEGTLKADVAHALTGLPTIGLPGVSTWRPALPILRELGCTTVRLAIDADARDKAAVARALAAVAEALPAVGIAVELERWDIHDGKGIDDLLAAGKTANVLTGEAVRQAISEIVTGGTADTLRRTLR